MRGPAAVEWRLFRGWSPRELRERLDRAGGLERNWGAGTVPVGCQPREDAGDAPGGRRAASREGPSPGAEGTGWEEHGSRSVIARGPPGPAGPGGPFDRAVEALRSYAFSDPSIVEAHYPPGAPLEGRRMLLELKPLGLRYLCPVVVARVRERREDASGTDFGFRYDTLEGHVERGCEWFLLRKDAATGDLTFRIEATWMPGDFPNWWSRLGFALVGRRYQRAWHRRAHRRMAHLVHGGDLPRRPRFRGAVGGRGGKPRVVFTPGPEDDRR